MHDVKVIVNGTHIKIMLKNWKRGEKLDYNKNKVDEFLKEIGEIINLRTSAIKPPYVQAYECKEFVHQKPTPDEISVPCAKIFWRSYFRDS